MTIRRSGGKAGELEPRLLRLKDSAKYLSVSPATLRRLVQQGLIPVIRVSDGNTVPWLIDSRDLDQFIERSKVTL